MKKIEQIAKECPLYFTFASAKTSLCEAPYSPDEVGFHPTCWISSVENGFNRECDLSHHQWLATAEKLEKVKAGVEPPPYNIVFNYMREL